MTDTPDTSVTDATPAAESDVPSPTEIADRTKPSGVDALPEWAQTEIRSLRKESASYRTRAKELEDANKTELQKALDALEASKAELTTTRTELARNTVMAEFGLDAEYAGFLSGDEAQMRAAAEKLSKLAAHQTGESLQRTPVAGLTPGGSAKNTESGEPFDPVAIAASLRRDY